MASERKQLMKRALIAMSGGVDSSMAAKLTLDMGFECVGCTMKLHSEKSAAETPVCGSGDDAEDAKAVAESLGMSFQVLDLQEDFKENVIDRFIDAYFKGQTPNPCIDCNRYMKFGKLYAVAKAMACDYIVTGHYVRIEKEGSRYLLKKAFDETKDQSYVLYNLTQEQLAHTLFPLGEYRKTQVREMAAQNGFVNAKKKDSQDICFVPDGKYADVIKTYTGKPCPAGDYVDLDGNVIGTHKGVIHYTVGQHKKLGMSFPQPMYVCRIDPQSNTVTLGSNDDLFSREVYVRDFNWISGAVPEVPFRCKAKIRYRQAEQPALITPLSETEVSIVFDEPQRAVTPGQSTVLYDGDTVLGGGIISPC